LGEKSNSCLPTPGRLQWGWGCKLELNAISTADSKPRHCIPSRLGSQPSCGVPSQLGFQNPDTACHLSWGFTTRCRVPLQLGFQNHKMRTHNCTKLSAGKQMTRQVTTPLTNHTDATHNPATPHTKVTNELVITTQLTTSHTKATSKLVSQLKKPLTTH
jgi:hypothetical protein